MRWSQILPEAIAEGCGAQRIASVTADSRAVVPGSLFFALRGHDLDGHDFIGEALAAGAVGVVAERQVAVPPETRLVVDPQARTLFGQAAARLYGRPSRDLPVVAVTGTNGKTTLAWLVAGLFRQGGVIGTLGWGRPGVLEPAGETTPDPVTFQERLDRMRQDGYDGVAMEASSHGLEQQRLAGTHVAGAVWTNLTPEHLDYHGDYAAYRRAKQRLFERPELGFAVLNAEDPEGPGFARALDSGVPIWWFGGDRGDVRVAELQCRPDGLLLGAETPAGSLEVRSGLVGSVNASNLLAAIATGLALGLTPEEVARRLSAVPPVPGRMEDLGETPAGARIWIDFAHTPDALERTLTGARELTEGNLWAVFGAGGDRDRAKRPAMGAVADRIGDRVVLTSDNPRGEPPEAILAAIASGMDRLEPEYLPDRAEAIAAALEGAGPGDGVVIAGKGHENYQEVGGRFLPFSDREAVARWRQRVAETADHDDPG